MTVISLHCRSMDMKSDLHEDALSLPVMYTCTRPLVRAEEQNERFPNCMLPLAIIIAQSFSSISTNKISGRTREPRV
jgi:hypothetical protein